MRTFSFLCVVALLTAGCSSDQRVATLVDRAAVQDTVTRLFVATDNRDWNGVRAVLADSVLIDMTSTAGGVPIRVSSQQITKTWDEDLRGLKAIHHQEGNMLVSLRDGEADVSCYGIAVHYLPNPSGMNSRSFVGTYDFHLVKRPDGWKINLFRFNLKYLSGNMNLQEYLKEKEGKEK